MIALTQNLAPPRTPADVAAREIRERLPVIVHHARFIPDTRRRDRLAKIVLGCLEQPVGPLSKVFVSRAQAKAAYGFMSREEVRAPDVSRTLAEVVMDLPREAGTLFAVHDSTSLNLTRSRRTKGLGPVNDAPRCKGIILHNSIAVEPDGVVLGLIAQRSWARPPADRRPANVKLTARQPKPIEDKESFKWIAGIRACRDLTADQPVEKRPRWIHIMDREGDIHEVFEEILTPRDGLPADGAVVRACWNRKVLGEHEKAFEALAAEPVKAVTEIHVPVKSGSQKTRTVRVEIRTLRAELNPNCSKRPQRRKLALNLLEIREIDSTKKSAILWRIWTTEPTDTVSDALRVVEIYTYRWRVEDVHLATKSGMKVETGGFDSMEDWAKWAAISTFVAAQITRLRDLSRRRPEAPAALVFSPPEIEVLKRLPPSRKTVPPGRSPASALTIEEAARRTATLAGWWGRRGDGPPGVRTLWFGMMLLRARAAGFEMAKIPPYP